MSLKQRLGFLDLSDHLPSEIQGIISRSLPPTTSIWCSSLARREDFSVGWPTRVLSMKSAYELARLDIAQHGFIRALVSSLGQDARPDTYWPYSAVFEDSNKSPCWTMRLSIDQINDRAWFSCKHFENTAISGS